MKTLLTILLILVVGCSTAPLARQVIPNHFQYVPQQKIKIVETIMAERVIILRIVIVRPKWKK
jgi:hypothetical protein